MVTAAIHHRAIARNSRARIARLTADGRLDGAKVTQYAWSPRYIDAPVARYQDVNGDGDTNDLGDSVLLYTADANFNVTGLINVATGAVVERYAYDPYGKVTYYDGNWTELANQVSAFNNTILYTGRTLDTETGLFYYRARYYDVNLMRFLGRDPIGADNNPDRYSGNRPLTSVDPFGLLEAEITLGPTTIKVDENGGSVTLPVTSFIRTIELSVPGITIIKIVPSGSLTYSASPNRLSQEDCVLKEKDLTETLKWGFWPTWSGLMYWSKQEWKSSTREGSHYREIVFGTTITIEGQAKASHKYRMWEPHLCKCFDLTVSGEPQYKGESQALRTGLAAGAVVYAISSEATAVIAAWLASLVPGGGQAPVPTGQM